jgi:hypothetical protein
MILMFEVFEIFRRWVWIYFRVEWECINKNIDRETVENRNAASISEVQASINI